MKTQPPKHRIVVLPKLLFTLTLPALLASGGICRAGLVNQWSANSYTSGNWLDSVGGVNATNSGSPQAVANVFGTNAGVTVNSGYFTVPAVTTGLSNFTVAVVFKPTAQMPDYNSSAGWSANYWASIPLIGFDVGGTGMADWGISYGGNTGFKAITGVGVQTPAGVDIQQQSANLVLNAGHALVLQVNATGGQIITCLDGTTVATTNGVAITNRSATATAYIGGGVFVNPIRLPGYLSVIQIYNDATNDPVALSQSLLSKYGGPAPITLSSAQGADPGNSVVLTVGVPASATLSSPCTVTLTSDNSSVLASRSVVLGVGVTTTNVSLPVLALGTANLTATSANLGSAAIAIYGLDESGLANNWLADGYVSGTAWVDTISGISAATQTGTELAVPGAFGATHQGVSGGTTGGFNIPAGTIDATMSNYTVAVVYKPTAAGPVASWYWNSAGIIGYDIGGSGQGDFGISWGGDGSVAGGQRTVMGVGMATAGVDQYLRSPTGTPLALNSTHSAVLQINGAASNILFAVDGMQMGPLINQPIRSLTGTRNIGVIRAVGSAFPGYIAEIRIYTNATVNPVGLSGMLLKKYAAPTPISLSANAPRFVELGGSVTLSVGVPASATLSGSFTVNLSSDNWGVVSSTSVVFPVGVTTTNVSVTILSAGSATITASGSGLGSVAVTIGGLAPRALVNVFRASSQASLNYGSGANNGDPINAWAGDTNGAMFAQWNLVGSTPTFAVNATLAGTPAVTFSGDTVLVIDSTGDPALNPVAGLNNFSCAVVFKTQAPGTGSSGSPWWQQSGLVNNETGGVVDDWGVTVDAVGQISLGLGNPDVTISQLGYNTVSPLFHVVVGAVDTLNGQMRLTLDDQPMTTNTTGISVDTRANYNQRFGDRGFAGQIAEIRFYNGALNTAETTNLISALQATYNLVWPDQALCSISAAGRGEDLGNDVVCTVTIPAGVNASSSKTVTVTSSNATAVTVGGGATLTLTFAAGATNVQSFPAHMLAAGISELTASCPALVSSSVTLEALGQRTIIEVFRASSLTNQLAGLTDGGQVSSWAGDIDSTRIAVPLSVAPTFRMNATPSGSPSVLFDATQFQDLLLSGAQSPVGGLNYFSVLLVFKVNGAATSSGTQWYDMTGILDAEEGGTWNDWGISLNASGNLGFGIGNSDYTLTDTGPSLVNSNQFHVAVAAWDPTRQQMRINIDDQPTTVSPATAAISAFPRNPSALRPSGGNIHIGSTVDHGWYFSGELAEVRFYNGALTGSEATNALLSARGEYGILTPQDLTLYIQPATSTTETIHWSAVATASGYVLYSTTNLTNAWTPAGLSVGTVGNQSVVTVTNLDSARFYRLHR